jgi:ABC-type transport system substrate-binding protein
VLAARPNLRMEERAGTEIQYLGFNLRDPLLADARVRQAISCAIDRNLIIKTCWAAMRSPRRACCRQSLGIQRRRPALRFTIQRAPRRLLDEAGHPRSANGIRFHLTMKTSNDEGTRLLAAVLQQQLAAVGIALDIRSFEYATFYSDVTRGAFQMYSLRWIGGNEQPDIFSYAFLYRALFAQGRQPQPLFESRASMRCSTTRRRAEIQTAAAPTTPKRSRFWPAICPPSISGIATRSWCITAGSRTWFPRRQGSYTFLKPRNLARPQ